MTRPWSVRSSAPAGHGAVSASTPSSGPWPQYPKDPSGWSSNQPDAYSSYSSGTGEWYDSSAGVTWSQPNNPAFTSQSSGAFAMPNLANPTTPSAYQQQQQQVQPQTAPGMSKSGDAMLPFQPGPASGTTYGWNNDASASQWQTQSQWPWSQNNNQWQSSQPFQYMVCHLCVRGYAVVC